MAPWSNAATRRLLCCPTTLAHHNRARTFGVVASRPIKPLGPRSDATFREHRATSWRVSKARKEHLGILQMPRTRSERLAHLEILNNVPFELVPAYIERNRFNKARMPGGSIGKILRRHRYDADTQLVATLLRACVEKRSEAMLWDTIADEVRHVAPRLQAADVGIILACFMKASFKRDVALVEALLRQVASFCTQASAKPLATSKDSTPSEQRLLSNLPRGTSGGVLVRRVDMAGGRRHQRLKQTAMPNVTNSNVLGVLPQTQTRGIPKVAVARLALPSFPEHALSFALGAVEHYGLGRKCADAVARLCGQVQRCAQQISGRTLCRIAHYVGALASSGHSGPPLRLLNNLCPELEVRVASWKPALRMAQSDIVEEDSCASAQKLSSVMTAGDLCILAHVYSHTREIAESRRLLRSLLVRFDDVALLQLSASELIAIVNSFSKLTHAESEPGLVDLFDKVGRQLVASNIESMDLRNVSVALNAFAQASIRHEPLFYALAVQIPTLVGARECDMRHVAMLAHAHVRVGLSQASVLPLLWERATRLARTCDAHGASVMLFAVTKASAIADGGSGEALFDALGARFMEILSDQGTSLEPSTVVVTAYALARSGCASRVRTYLWRALVVAATKGVDKLSLSESANMAAALAQAVNESSGTSSRSVVEASRGRAPRARRVENVMIEFGLPAGDPDVLTFAGALRACVDVELAKRRNVIEPMVASKIVTSFAALRVSGDGVVDTVTSLARSSLTSGTLGVGPLRGISAALTRLGVHDEDLLLALNSTQRSAGKLTRETFPSPPQLAATDEGRHSSYGVSRNTFFSYV